MFRFHRLWQLKFRLRKYTPELAKMSVFQPILSNHSLIRLKEHKYSCVNHSFLDQYLNPFWTWLELKVPVSVHPNMMTLSGLVVNIFTTLSLVYFSPDAKGTVSLSKFYKSFEYIFFLCSHRDGHFCSAVSEFSSIKL